MHRLHMYSPFRKWKKGDPLASPYVRLSVGRCQTVEGEMLLSPKLKTAKEIDEVVDSLKKELEEFRAVAKKELPSLKSRIFSTVK